MMPELDEFTEMLIRDLYRYDDGLSSLWDLPINEVCARFCVGAMSPGPKGGVGGGACTLHRGNPLSTNPRLFHSIHHNHHNQPTNRQIAIRAYKEHSVEEVIMFFRLAQSHGLVEFIHDIPTTSVFVPTVRD